MSERLRRICEAFKQGLTAVRQFATDPANEALAGKPVNSGCPPKQAICSALVYCGQHLKKFFNVPEVRWRCSMGRLTNSIRTKVQNILEGVYPAERRGEDP